MIGLSKNIIDTKLGSPKEEFLTERWDSAYHYFISIGQNTFVFTPFFKNGLSAYVEYAGRERIDDIMLFEILETYEKKEKWRRDKTFDCWHCSSLNLLAYLRQNDERDTISICTPETFLSLLASVTKGLWSERLGCFEAHLKRKYDYPELFGLKKFEVSAREIEQARLRDVSEYWKLQADAIEVIESINSNSSLSEVHQACVKIEEELFPRCAEIGRTDAEVLDQLIPVQKKWRAYLKTATEYTPEQLAKITVVEGISDYLIASLSCELAYQVRRKDSPIRENEIVPSLLCESPKTIKWFLEWDGKGKGQVIRAAAIDLLNKLDSFPRKQECLEALGITEDTNAKRVPPILPNKSSFNSPPLPPSSPKVIWSEEPGFFEMFLKSRSDFPGLFSNTSPISAEQIRKAQEADKQEAEQFSKETAEFIKESFEKLSNETALGIAKNCAARLVKAATLVGSVSVKESKAKLKACYDALWKTFDKIPMPEEERKAGKQMRSLEALKVDAAFLYRDVGGLLSEDDRVGLMLTVNYSVIGLLGNSFPEIRNSALNLIEKAFKNDPKNSSKYIGFLRSLGVSDYKLAQHSFASAFRTGEIYLYFYLGFFILFRGSQALQKFVKPQPINCPSCGLLNPPKSLRCDCGTPLN